jgi:hypothetical protein
MNPVTVANSQLTTPSLFDTALYQTVTCCDHSTGDAKGLVLKPQKKPETVTHL